MPFPGGIDAPPNGTLILSVLAALLYLMALRCPASLRRTAVKTAAVALLALLAAIEAGPVLLVVALAMSAIGDALLAGDGEPRFLAGLSAFLLAHVAYVALFAGVGEGPGVVDELWRTALVGAGAIAGTVLLRRLLPTVPAAMRLPVAVYAVAIFAMLAAAATVAPPLVAAGAALFFVSDAVLASERFLLAPGSRHRDWTGPAVWLLYYAAQGAITLALLN